jgi:hypothetical protein
LDALLVAAARARTKSPALAKWLSIFLPGSGQIYCGEWIDGLNALALSVATGYLLVGNILEKRIQEVALNSLFLFNRFYQGDKDNAVSLALRSNERLNRSLAEKILNVLKER